MDVTEQVEARRAAELANRLKDEFLAAVSHGLRAQLNAILGWGEIIGNGKLDAGGIRRAAETIVKSARSQARLIEDLLDVSRIISGRLRLVRHPLKLSPLVETAVEAVAPSAEVKEIKVGISIASNAEAAMIVGDAERLKQIFWNPLTNAIKFTPSGGRIEVGVERIDSHLEFTVKDTGYGIKAEFLPHIFDRLYQSDRLIDQSGGGLGLGLAIVKNLVELHGGLIRAASQGTDRGSTFIVMLPLEKDSSPGESKIDDQTGDGKSEFAIICN